MELLNLPASRLVYFSASPKRTDVWPYSPQGHLKLFFGEEECDGSGVLVGPHHVLTCAHNVYDPKEKTWVNRIVFCPGLMGQSAPFGSAEVTKIFIDKSWADNDETADMALLTLSVPLGQWVGYLGLASMSDEELGTELVEVTGYPADKGVVYMWTMFHELKKSMTPDTLNYEIDTYQGQSGGAVWIKHGDENMPYVIGVHTRGKTATNRGVRISPVKFTWLIGILSETAELCQGAALVLPSTVDELLRPQEVDAELLAKQQNEEQTVKLFEGLAQKGDKRAQRCLANLYRKGQGVERSLGKTIYWYKKAAEQEDPVSQKMLADFYKAGKADKNMSIEQSRKIAADLYQKSAEGGNEYALKALGDCYSAGCGVDQNDTMAFTYYQKAAETSLASAQERLANCYYLGKGVPQDYVKAAQWYKEAADQGYPLAQKMFGDLNRDARGVTRSYEVAAEFYTKAAHKGNAYAQKSLADLYARGQGVQPNDGIAAEWYQKAIDNKYFTEEKRHQAREALNAIQKRSVGESMVSSAGSATK